MGRKTSLVSLLGVGVCAILSGCGSNGQSSQSGGSAVEYVYAGNNMGITPTSPITGDEITAYGVDASGNLSQLPGFPLPLQFPPTGLTSDPQSRFLIVTGGFNATVNLLVAAINPDHTLALRSDPGFGSGALIDPLGRFVFGANGNGISVFAISSNPSLSFLQVRGSPFGIGFLPRVVDPAGNYLLASSANQLPTGGFSVATFRIDLAGSLTQTSSITSTFPPIQLALNPSGKFLYLVYIDAGNNYHLQILHVDAAGNLTPSNLDSIFGGPGLNSRTFSIAFIPESGNFVFGFLSPAPTTITLAAFPIDMTTGVVSSSSVFTTSLQDTAFGGFTLDSTGQRLFRGFDSGNDTQPGQLQSFTISPTSGQIVAGPAIQTACCLDALTTTR